MSATEVSAPVSPGPAAEIAHLSVRVTATGAPVLAGADLRIGAGQILGVAGETGSGKSTLGLSLLGFTAPGLEVAHGHVVVGGQTLLGAGRIGAEQLRRTRGAEIASVPQDPASALNPGLRLRECLAEVLAAHGVNDPDEQHRRRSDLFAAVGLPGDEEFAARYPHQVSGGQLQRVTIAMAFALDPRVVVMDEPTTGLDVSTTTRVAALVRELSTSRGVAVVLISHDLRLLLSIADTVAVVYQGEVVEQAPPATLRSAPNHPYTRRLLASSPVTDAAVPRPRGATRYGAATVLELRDLSARYGDVTVTHGLNLTLESGSCVAVVGESGSGKTTTARAVAGLHTEYGGQVLLAGEVLAPSVSQRSAGQRKSLQYVFQNPYGSLNPRHSVGRSIATARRALLGITRSTARADTVTLIEQVGLRRDHLYALPHQLSGGQRQRVALARALAGEPDVLVCDEVTSSLDLSVQAEIVDLLQRLQEQRGLSMLFITHDLGLARQVADTTLVLLRGRVVEHGATSEVLSRPAHEYTASLLEASRSVAAAAGDG